MASLQFLHSGLIPHSFPNASKLENKTFLVKSFLLTDLKYIFFRCETVVIIDELLQAVVWFAFVWCTDWQLVVWTAPKWGFRCLLDGISAAGFARSGVLHSKKFVGSTYQKEQQQRKQIQVSCSWSQLKKALHIHFCNILLILISVWDVKIMSIHGFELPCLRRLVNR